MISPVHHVIPYDKELISIAHDAGQRISYHTCGGMMPILEKIASMQPDAMETFSPPAMGGDTILKEYGPAKSPKTVLKLAFLAQNQRHFELMTLASKKQEIEFRQISLASESNAGNSLQTDEGNTS